MLSLSQNKFWKFVLLHLKKKSKEKWRSIFSGNFLNNENLPPTHFWLLSFVLVSATNSVTYYFVIFFLFLRNIVLLALTRNYCLFVCIISTAGEAKLVFLIALFGNWIFFFLFTVERFQTFILETNFVHFESKAFEQT